MSIGMDQQDGLRRQSRGESSKWLARIGVVSTTVLMAVLAFVAGPVACARGADAPGDAAGPITPGTEFGAIASGTEAGGAPIARVANPDYKLAPGDLIVIDMFDQKEMRSGQRLTATGEIRLPMIGRVVLRGLTVRDAEQRIEELYRDGGYFVSPQVMLFVQEYAERFVSILGQVRNPARIPLPEESNSLGILQAITLAGGFTRIANTKSVQVTRKNAEGVQEQHIINVGELLNARGPADEKREFQLHAGDIVFVREVTL